VKGFRIALPLCMVGLFLAVTELKYLMPFKHDIFHRYGPQIGVFIALVFLNIATGANMILSRIRLKDTGRKMQELEKQVRSGSAVSAELGRRLAEQERR